MTPTRYNTRNQEALAETRRVRVGLVYHNGGRVKEAHVYLVDMVSHKVLDYGYRDRYRHYWKLAEKNRDDANKLYGAGTFSKKNAIVAAKALALRSKVPFHPTNDLVPSIEIKAGPPRYCLLCKDTQRYSWEAFICQDCKRLYGIGNLHVQPDKLALIDTDELVQYPGTANLDDRGGTTVETRLASAILQIAGVVALGKRPKDEEIPDELMVNGGVTYTNRPPLFFRAKPGQVEGMRKLIQLIRDMIRSGNLYGQRDGSNLLTGLIKGEMHPNDFSDNRNHARHK